jgi:DNA replication ATP-dependent helicase Dna2
MEIHWYFFNILLPWRPPPQKPIANTTAVLSQQEHGYNTFVPNMYNLSHAEAQLLFEQTINSTHREELTPAERIPKYRSVLEELFQLLTRDAPTHLGNLFARQVYIGKEYSLAPHIQDAMHRLRKTGNTVVHDAKSEPTQLDDQRCAYQLAECIAYFAKTDVPVSLKSYYADQLDTLTREKPSTPERRRAEEISFRAVVTEILLPQGTSTEHLPARLIVETEEQGSFHLKLWNRIQEDGSGRDLRLFAHLVNPYQTIYVERAVADLDRPGEYFAAERTLLVLEPDYLIDAKALASCRQMNGDIPLWYLYDHFTQGQVTDRVVLGNIVGTMLDDRVTYGDKRTFRDTFTEVMTRNPLQFLFMAHDQGTYRNTQVQQVYLEAQEHQDTIDWALRQKQGHRLMVEPTFISNRYGLQGRIDLLTQREDDPNRKDIIELKSGRFPDARFGMYPNHKAQTLAYDLLLQSVFPGRVGSNDLLYSKASLVEKPLRNIPGEHYQDKQDLLMLRNQLVANDLRLARGDLQPLVDLLEEDAMTNIPKFAAEDFFRFRETLLGLPSLTRTYIQAYLTFIFRELRVAKVGDPKVERSQGFAATWLASKSEKVDNSDALVYLRVDKPVRDHHVRLTFSQDLFAQTPGFRVGDMVILYPTPDPEQLDPLGSQILKGFITELSEAHVTVRLVHRQVDKTYFKQKTFWALERDFRDSSFRKMMRSLYLFAKAPEKWQELLLGTRRPTFEAPPEVLASDLNEVQCREVGRALAAEDYYLIQGPPGTGKTSKVLCELVERCQSRGEQVMVVAFTNRAVDEIGDKLQERGVDCIRLGHSTKPYSWSQICEAHPQLEVLHQRLLDARVLVATQSTFINSLDLLHLKTFDTLVVDEASQLLEPQLVGIIPLFRRVILIGDENQLPAVVMQSETDSVCREDKLREIGLHNLRNALFTRLKQRAEANGWDDCYGMLTVHYRMHEAIADFPNEHFYGGRLEAGSSRQQSGLSAKETLPDGPWRTLFGEHRLAFLPSPRSTRRKVNDREAQWVAELVAYIRDWYGAAFDPQQTVGIITPFRAQIANIRRHLPSDLRNVLMVDTVERYQGSERDIILLSFAVNHPSQLRSIESINSSGVDCKLNVALTRAKDHLVLLGTDEVLQAGRSLRPLLRHIRDTGGYRSAREEVVKDVGEGLF